MIDIELTFPRWFNPKAKLNGFWTRDNLFYRQVWRNTYGREHPRYYQEMWPLPKLDPNRLP